MKSYRIDVPHIGSSVCPTSTRRCGADRFYRYSLLAILIRLMPYFSEKGSDVLSIHIFFAIFVT